MLEVLEPLVKYALPISAFLIALSGFFYNNHHARGAKNQAEKACNMAEESKQISLNRLRSVPSIKIANVDSPFDFMRANYVNKDLHYAITVINDGDIAIQNVHLEMIGITPLTYKLACPAEPVKPLPTQLFDTECHFLVLPKYYLAIDLRKPLTAYLKKLSAQLTFEDAEYLTTLNVLVLPTASGDLAPSGTQNCQQDRTLIKITFNPIDFSPENVSFFTCEFQDLKHRVYAYED